MAGSSAGSIFVDLLLNSSKYEDGLRKSARQTGNWSNQTNSQFKKSSESIDVITASLGRLATVAAGAFSVQKIIQYSDSYRNLQSRLSLVTDSSQELADTTQQLFDIAQSNSQPLEATIDAYTRLKNSLTATQEASVDMIKFTDLLSKTLLISGTSAEGAATFFQQFGQAASSDFKAIGQELQTFADQNPRFYGILRDEATKYGKTLKQMAADGELSFEFVSKALFNASDSIERDSARISGTVQKAFTQLNNSLMTFVGTSNSVSAASDLISRSLIGISDFIDIVNNDANALATAFTGLVGVMIEFYKTYNEYALKVAESTNFFNLNAENVKQYEDNIKSAEEALVRLGSELDQRNKDVKAYLEEHGKLNQTTRSPEQIGPKPIDKEALKAAKKEQQELNSLYEKNEGYIRSMDNATLNYNRTLEELDTLLQKGKISTEEYYTALSNIDQEYDKATQAANVWAFDVEAAAKRAAENIQDQLADFLFDPFDQGLKGMLRGFVDILRRMAAEAAASQILGGLFGKDGKSGGLLSGIGGKISSSLPNFSFGSFQLPAFAEGGYLGPGQWGIAGEKEAELIYGGRTGATIIPPDKMGGGKNTYVFNVGEFATQSDIIRLQNMVAATAGPGVIEQRVNNAQARGAL